MKQFLLYGLSILIPVFVGIPVVNYIVDPSHLYSLEYIDKIVDGLKQGKNVENVSDLNERAFKEKYIKALRGRSFDYAIVGGSRVMQISTEDFDSCAIINLGMSSSKLEDLIAMYQLCKENNIRYKKIIIGVEPTFFNAGDRMSSWKYLESYYNTFLGNSNSSTDYSLVTNLFSVSYFKSSIVHQLKRFIRGGEKFRLVDTNVNDGATKIWDGSITYEKEFRERPQSAIDAGVSTGNMPSSFYGFNSLSKERIDLFNRLINALRTDSVDIIFFKSAYHPILYKRIMKLDGIPKAFKYIDDFAQKNNIPVIGSYNPDDIGLNKYDFLDGSHERKEAIDKTFRGQKAY